MRLNSCRNLEGLQVVESSQTIFIPRYLVVTMSLEAIILVQAVIPYSYLTDIVVDGRRAEALFNVGLAMSYVFGKLVEDQPYV